MLLTLDDRSKCPSHAIASVREMAILGFGANIHFWRGRAALTHTHCFAYCSCITSLEFETPCSNGAAPISSMLQQDSTITDRRPLRSSDTHAHVLPDADHSSLAVDHAWDIVRRTRAMRPAHNAVIGRCFQTLFFVCMLLWFVYCSLAVRWIPDTELHMQKR